MSETGPNQAGDPQPGPGGRSVLYKGAPLEAERGPGLGCFWFQLAVLSIAVIITPLTVVWGWPEAVSAGLLFLVVLLLLLTGQTIIFLLRLVAADRRAAGRRRPLASATRTVGELEDERLGATDVEVGATRVELAATDVEVSAEGDRYAHHQAGDTAPGDAGAGGAPDDQGPVRQ